MIEALKYLFLGIVQGVTEVLPISSSGHVEIVKRLMNIDFYNSLIFLILVNTGSLITFIFIYYKKLWRIIKGTIVYIVNKEKRNQYKNDFILMMKILLASIPAGVVGILFNDQLNELLLAHGLLIVGIGLLLTATVLYYITSDEPFRSKENHLGWLDVFLMGVAQSVALFPGVSRSGMTSSTAIKRGASVQAALDFSFIMYIPVSLGSTLLMVQDLFDNETAFNGNDIFNYFLAFFGAMVATYIAYKIIFNIFRSGKLRLFSYYCLSISAFALLLYIIE